MAKAGVPERHRSSMDARKETNPLTQCLVGRAVPRRRREHKCPQHASEDLRYSCEDCSFTCVCAECVVTGSHRNHKVKAIPDAAAIVKKKLTQDGRVLQQQLTDLHGTLRILHSLQHSATEGLHRTKGKFKRSFQAVYRCLGQKQSLLLRELEVLSQVGANTLRDLSTSAQNYRRYLLAKHRELDNLRILGDRNPAAALNAYVELKHTYAQLLVPTEDHPSDMRETMEVPFWQLNSENIDNLLRKTDNYIKSSTSDIQTLLNSMQQLVVAFCELPLPLDEHPAEAKSYLEALNANQLIIAELQQQYIQAQEEQQAELAAAAEHEEQGDMPELDTDGRKGMEEHAALNSCVVVGGNLVQELECPQAVLRVYVRHIRPVRHLLFYRKDPLRREWDLRRVDLRPPYLCVHIGLTEHSELESVVSIRDVTIKSFDDPNVSALTQVAKREYPNGIEILQYNKTKQLTSYWLLSCPERTDVDRWLQVLHEIQLQKGEHYGGTEESKYPEEEDPGGAEQRQPDATDRRSAENVEVTHTEEGAMYDGEEEEEAVYARQEPHTEAEPELNVYGAGADQLFPPQMLTQAGLSNQPQDSAAFLHEQPYALPPYEHAAEPYMNIRRISGQHAEEQEAHEEPYFGANHPEGDVAEQRNEENQDDWEEAIRQLGDESLISEDEALE